MDGCLFLFLGVHTGEAMWGYSEKVALCKLERGVSPESNPASTLILDF